MPLYMQYDGIDGDVTSQGHEKWIELTSLQWGCGRGMTSATGSAADREASTPRVSEVVLTKVCDGASSSLLRTALGLGPVAEGQTVRIDFCKTDTSEPEPFLTLTLDNTLISG